MNTHICIPSDIRTKHRASRASCSADTPNTERPVSLVWQQAKRVTAACPANKALTLPTRLAQPAHGFFAIRREPDYQEGVLRSRSSRVRVIGYAELAHRHPGRIASYVMLPLPHIDASLREMARGLDELGCVGVNMNISCLGRSVAEADFEPIYAEVNRRGAILFVHPSVTGVCSPVINDWGFRASIGNSVEDAMFVAHMIARQIPHRYPNVRFIVPHLGGPIPMLLNRLDKQGVRDLGNLAELPSVTARRFWYDTVCYGSKASFTCACEAFGVEKLVAGSDYPVLQDYEEYRETFAYIERMGLPAEDAERILHHNAQDLFGLPR
jgi:6-methylsalicylate decarboxylase